MNDKKTLGEAIFVDIESNAYLNELHENILIFRVNNLQALMIASTRKNRTGV